ncbi:uracil-DNA glycosylase [Campylobacterota bacterium]|nr:uracil-DNA glycosylase [Campylobacterota bacterium]
MALEASWQGVVGGEFDKPYMGALREFLAQEIKAKKIYPKTSEWFAAYEMTPFEQVKVVILGQDPYHHSEDQAHGLAFSVKRGVALPPSLQNIFKEIAQENLADNLSQNCGDLSAWARRGVLLLNSVLTVEANRAESHRNRGWEQFTDACVAALSGARENLVFMLWGNYAIGKQALIDRSKHLVLTAPHPSPLSARRGFFGCQHFKKANEYLASHNIAPIDWRL